MLPSSGYFQSVPCPFYNNGLCERHHCQYRHVKKDILGKAPYNNLVDESLVSSTSDDGRKSDLLKMVDIAILKAQEDVERNKAALEAVKYSSVKEPKKVENVIPVNYTPTPVSMCVLQKEKPTSKNSLVPEYRPTPIAQLKKLQKLSEKEYDPVNNFSTPVPPAKRKKSEYDPSEVKVIANSREFGSDDTLDHYTQKRPKLSNDLSDSSGLLEIDNPSTGDEGDLSAEFSDDSSDDEKVVTSTEKEDISNETQTTSDVIDDEKISTSNIDSSKTIPSINQYNFVDKILLESKKNDETITSGSSNTKNIPGKAIIAKPENLSAKQQKVKSIPESGKKESKVDKCTKPKSADKAKNSIEVIAKLSKTEKKSELENNNLSKSKTKLENKSSTRSSKPSSESNLVNNNKLKISEKSETKISIKSLKSDNDIISKSKKVKGKSEAQTRQKSSKSNKITIETTSKSKDKPENCNKSSNNNLPNNDKKSESEKAQKLKGDNTQKTGSTEKHKVQKKLPVLSKVTSDKHIHASDISKIHSKTEPEICSSNKTKSYSKTSSKLSSHQQKRSNNEHSKTKGENSVQRSKHVELQRKDALNVSKHKKHSRDEKHHKASPLVDKSKCTNAKKFESNGSSSGDEISSLASDANDTAIDIDSDIDEHDTYEECWRIFNESSATSNSAENLVAKKVERENKTLKTTNDEAVPSKKRIAHQPNIVRATPSSSATRISPGQVMQNRFIKLQEMHNSAVKSEEKKVSSAFLNQLSHVADTGKKRIAHVPNASLLAAAAQKQKLLNRNTVAPPSPTLAMTSTKGEKRIAHIPAVARSNRPIIPAEYGSKVPCNIRQRYLDNFIDECLKFCDTEEEAYHTALEEEKNAYNRSANRAVYLNVAVNTLKKLRNKMSDVNLGSDTSSDSDVKKKSSFGEKRTVSHEYVLGGAKAARTSYSIHKRKPLNIEETDIKGVKLYKLLKPYILSEEQLDENGFPRQHPTNHGQAVIVNPRQKKQISNNPLERTCCRCQTKYRVTVKGKYVRDEECIYHWGRLWKRRIAGAIDSRYSCCQGDSQSEGCCVAQGHVFEDYDCDNLKGYVKTLNKSPPPDGNYGVYSLDCEMCYSTAGIELTRITVIAPTLKPIYETMVKPENPVIDYNTRFSGITEEDLCGVSTTIGDVQAVLLSLFNSQTILIGHSLESDFKALRLIHRTVVDTSVVFPHKMGLPYKRALRTLMAEYLNKIIQNNVDGHDSQEDALACMELMLWKIKEDIRKANR